MEFSSKQVHIAFLVCTLLFSGCTKLGPDFLKPDAPVADEWLEPEDTPDDIKITTDASEYAEWWKSFNDPVLDSFISMAYEQNLSLQIAGIRILESREIGRAHV